MMSLQSAASKIERIAHDTIMRGQKIGSAALGLLWPRTFSGAGSSLELSRHIAARGHRSVFFVTSKTPLKTGLVQPMVDILEAAGIRVTLYSEIRPDPTLEQVEDAARQLKAQDCDAVVVLGGGSAIDAAKLIAARARNRKSVQKMTGMLKVTRGMLPLYAVPTTAGTGSEVTIAAVVTNTQKQCKQAVVDPRLMPRAVALDGHLMLGVPAHITADTGMDALTHAVEAYVSRNASAQTDAAALEATRLIMTHLPTAVSDGKNVEARVAMAEAAHLAGKAFTRSGVGFVHAIAHNFGALYGIPHGRANAIIMPYVLDYSLPRCAPRLAELARACAIGDENADDSARAEALIARIRAMNEAFGIPQNVAELQSADIARIARSARAEVRFNYAVPRHMSQADCEALIRRMLPA